MQLHRVLALAVTAVLAFPLAASAGPGKGAENGGGKPSGFKVTGGGQIIADDSAQGAGDTVGFNAQEIVGDDPASEAPNDAARGQFQYVPRGQGGPAAPAEKFHGVVTCLLSGGEAIANEEGEDDEFNEALERGMARFGGYLRDNPSQAFTVDVSDNGQGGAAENDMILVRLTATPCADNPEDEDNDPDDLVRLGRGNVKIHNNPDGASALATLL